MVGSRKNKNDAWMPKRVYRGKSAYEYRPSKGICIKLLPLPEGPESEKVKADVWQAYNDQLTVKEYAVSDLIRDFHASPQFRMKGIQTQGDYRYYSKKILAVFGEMLPDSVQPVHIRKFMDKVGEKYLVSANRHHSYLSVLFAWGLERGLCNDNPAKKVRKFPETPRDRYVEKSEFEAVYRIALASSYPYVAHMMMIAYLCRMRRNEVLSLCEKHILEEGVFVERGKGSENEITRWSDKLRFAVKSAREMHPSAPVNMDRPLFHDKYGLAIKAEAFKSAWARIMKKAESLGIARFTFHDLKARGITNHKDNQAKINDAIAIAIPRPEEVIIKAFTDIFSDIISDMAFKTQQNLQNFINSNGGNSY